MRAYTFPDVSDTTLLNEFNAADAQDKTTLAVLLAQIAEIDARRLCVPAGYPSMRAYCVDERHWSEGCAYKRIGAARVARQFPSIFEALGEGRLHLASVCLLAPHLTPENVDALIGLATHQRKSEVERLLAERFPKPELLQLVRAIPASQAMHGSSR